MATHASPHYELEQQDDLYTLSAAAKRIHHRRATIRTLMQSGLLPYIQLDGDQTKYVTLANLQAAFRHQIVKRRTRPRDESGQFTPWT